MAGQHSDAVEGMNNHATTSDDVLNLPPGFRFHPTDEEVVTHYLTVKVLDPRFIAAAIAEVDLNKCEPWDMPSRAKIWDKDWYVFCQKDRKYPTGTRTNRATKAGYWKATGKDKEIYRGRRTLVGMKKTLVFYKGRAPRGVKTNWVMHEFRLEGQFHDRNLPPHVKKDEWVVCRVFNKSAGGITNNNNNNNNHAWPPEGADSATSFVDELLQNSSPPLVDPSSIACSNYSSKRDGDDLVEGNHQDDGHLSHSVGVLASASCLPRLLVQNYNPFAHSGYSLHGLMDGQFFGALELQPQPSLSEQCQGMQFSSTNPSLVTLPRDEARFDGGEGTGTDASNEISSAMTTLNRSDAGRCNEGGYYGYLESSLLDAADDYDLTLKLLMNQENANFLPIA